MTLVLFLPRPYKLLQLAICKICMRSRSIENVFCDMQFLRGAGLGLGSKSWNFSFSQSQIRITSKRKLSKSILLSN